MAFSFCMYECLTYRISFARARSYVLSRKVQSMEELSSSIRLIYENCLLYNEPDSVIGMILLVNLSVISTISHHCVPV